jgi:RNA-directed DNA polymerase
VEEALSAIRHRNELRDPPASSLFSGQIEYGAASPMGLWNWLRRLFGSGSAEPAQARAVASREQKSPAGKRSRRRRVRRQALRRDAGRRSPRTVPNPQEAVTEKRAYRLARPFVGGGFLDLSRDASSARLNHLELPAFATPEELATWLQIPLGRLAWLVHRFDDRQRPATAQKAHYHFRWLRKRSRGKRLIESPKPTLKQVQYRILREILDRVPIHSSAHGFTAGRSIVTNALPHAGKRVVVKLDLENFYPGVSLSRVVAIFRSLGYARETAIWLARLTTSALPLEMLKSDHDAAPYLRDHLPQGAPTSPALANLSAFSLDLRLAGLARSFGADYTRYADDLTFSGDEIFLRSLAVFLPLVEQIVRAERFRVNKSKRRIIRNNQRQQVTGVVVNERTNISRSDYDRLKATLTNCIRRGPSTQNHDRLPDFAAHLRGRIAHVLNLNRSRGEKLLELFGKIDWNR